MFCLSEFRKLIFMSRIFNNRRLRSLMKHLAMRRLKSQEIEPGRPLVALPPRNVIVETIEFNADERALYTEMFKHGRLVVGAYFREGTVLHHYAQVLLSPVM